MVVLSAYASATLWAGRSGWELALTTISLRDILAIVALVSIGFLLRAGRWHYYIRVLHWDVPLSHSLTAFVASELSPAISSKNG
jgi:hypothetical protein